MKTKSQEKKLYQGHARKRKREDSLYKRYALVMVAAFLYLLLGFFNQIPFFVFQLLFVLEGVALIQEGMHRSLRVSSCVLGGLFLLWTAVSAVRTSLTTGYSITVSNRVVICNLIYIGILSALIYQINQRSYLYPNPALKKICIAVCVIAMIVILAFLASVYSMYLTEVMDWEITDTMAKFFVFASKILAVLRVYPIAEWLVQISVLCSILLQSNKKYLEVHGEHQE
ncbi:MAG: hypothetical protein SO147_05595 [Clostridia bacterium]|nr:hypothetical protein [Clostridia bacterium]